MTKICSFYICNEIDKVYVLVVFFIMYSINNFSTKKWRKIIYSILTCLIPTYKQLGKLLLLSCQLLFIHNFTKLHIFLNLEHQKCNLYSFIKYVH